MKKEIVEKRGRFSILERKKVYESNWIRVFEDKAINEENKNNVTYGYVISRPAVCILPIDKEGNIYLNKEFKYALNKDSILAAGGFIEGSEEPLDAAKRELREETGISAKKWTCGGDLDFYGSISNFKYTLFFAEELSFGENKLDENESLEYFKIKIEDAYKMVMENKITYAGAVVLILKAWELKNRNE